MIMQLLGGIVLLVMDHVRLCNYISLASIDGGQRNEWFIMNLKAGISSKFQLIAKEHFLASIRVGIIERISKALIEGITIL